MSSLGDLYTHLKTLCEQWFYNKSTIDGYLNNKISKSSTVGLVKNDGSIDTTSYSTFNGNYNSLSNKPSIPSKTSDLSNDSGFITSSSLPTKTSDLVNDGEDGTNAFIDESDSRLSNARTPTAHTHTISEVNDLDSTLNAKLDSTTASSTFAPIIHTQASSTITDSNTYSNIGNTAQTQESINSAINSKLGELVDINFVTVVQTLPTASSSTMGKIYLVPITGTGTNNYAEYVTVKSGSTYTWEKFGEVSGSGLSVDWSDITSKPSTFTPSSHTHNNITNDGKVTVTGTNGGNLVVTNSSNQVIVQSSIDVLDGLVQNLISYGSS